jgi:hypothetical protein
MCSISDVGSMRRNLTNIVSVQTEQEFSLHIRRVFQLSLECGAQQGKNNETDPSCTNKPIRTKKKCIVISSQVLFHDGGLLHSKGQCTTVDYN